MADRDRVFVSPDGNDWKVHREGGEVISRHETQVAAISGARATIRELPEGSVCTVVVQGADGTFPTEWTYASEPSPQEG